MDLVKAFKSLYKYFTTISIKPVRSFDNTVEGVNESNIEEIKSQYTILYKYILQKTLKGKLDYLGVLLNGDDYFGKFIQRVILNHKVSTRCDTGLGRFSLTPDKKIIACPGSIGIEEMELGTLDIGLNEERMSQYYKIQTERPHCQDCEARYVCGGECMVVSYYKDKKLDSVDEVMCKLKKHLFELAVKFKFELILESEELFKTVYDGCQIKANRFQEDKELSSTLKKLNGQYTFMELKKIKDDENEKYSQIRDDLL
jgi:radical SAM protein with 4Fe4S-binding SPASM domain